MWPYMERVRVCLSRSLAKEFLCAEKNQKSAESVLTVSLLRPYKPVTNEGGAPLAQRSSPL